MTLTFTLNQWLRVVHYELSVFTKEEIKAGLKRPDGFIGYWDGVKCYVQHRIEEER